MDLHSMIRFIKLRKGILLFSTFIIIVASMYVIGFQSVKDETVEKNYGHSIDVEEAYPVNSPLTVEVHLRSVYLDGEDSVEVIEETIWSMEDFWATYSDWQLIEQSDEQVVFEKKINDISPLLKMTGHFGISQDGVLSIFKGKPDKQEIIQSFFQIDVKKVESYLQEQLMNGIPVKSKENYQKVLEVFKPYTKQ
jgi:forespore regulator of the sigma-K checkpoint